jgi:hypothetical protein
MRTRTLKRGQKGRVSVSAGDLGCPGVCVSRALMLVGSQTGVPLREFFEAVLRGPAALGHAGGGVGDLWVSI